MQTGPKIERNAEPSVLHIRQLTGDELIDRQTRLRDKRAWDRWKTTQPLEIAVHNDKFEVAEDFLTDLVSVPNIFAWFIPRAGRYARAAVLHDSLWDRASRDLYDRRQADKYFRLAMQIDGVDFLRRWIMWAAVRLGSLTKVGGKKGWWKDAPAVAMIMMIAIPIVAPPAALILVSSLVFYVFEMIVWSAQMVSHLPGLVIGRRSEYELNRPKLSMQT